MVADSHEESGTFFADVHAAFHFRLNFLAGAKQQDAGIRISHKRMGLAIFLCDISHVRCRLHHKAVYAASRDVIDKFRVRPVTGIHDFLSAFDQRCEHALVIGKHILAVPVGMKECTACPDDVIMHHHHRGITVCHGPEVLRYPVAVAVRHFPESIRVNARGAQERVPAEHLDQAGHAGGVDAGHVDRIRIVDAAVRIMPVECLHFRLVVDRSV